MSEPCPAEALVRPKSVLVLACLSAFTVIVDGTIVSVALPAMSADFDFAVSDTPWVVNAYTLAFAGFLLLGGRCSDVYGIRRTFMVSLTAFGLASLMGGLAVDPAMLLIARAGQGVAAAVLMPASLASLTQVFPEGAARASAIATWSMVGSTGATAGTVIGGLLTEGFGWRAVFIVNLPIIAIALILAATTLNTSGPPSGERRRLDVVGAALVTAGLMAIVYAVMESDARGWADPFIWGGAVLGALLLLILAAHQRRMSSRALIPTGLLRSRSVSAANLTMFLFSLAFLATPVLLSLYLQTSRGYSPLQTGLALFPSALALMVSGRSAGKLAIRLGNRTAAAGGIGVGTAGFILLSVLIGKTSSYALEIMAPTALIGAGMGFALTPLTLAATQGLAQEHHGIAAGLFNTTRQVSGAVGLAILSATAGGVTSEARPTAPIEAPSSQGYSMAFLVAVGCAVAAALLVLFLMPKDHPRKTAPSPQDAEGSATTSKAD